MPTHQGMLKAAFRLGAIAAVLFGAGCASRHVRHADSEVPDMPVRVVHTTQEIKLSDYSAPFGSAPESSDLQTVFLALPDQLAADMTVESRKGFIEQEKSDTGSHMFDPKEKYITWYNDNPFNPYQASSIFTIKILPSSKYRYIVAIHLVKPSALEIPPSPSNTFFLAPKGGQWVDITDEILPKKVSRDWYFQPRWSSNVVEAGPYEKSKSGYWTRGVKKYDLVWAHDHFRVKTPSSSKFGDDG